MIIGEEEGQIHQFLHGEEQDTTHPTIFSPPTLNQEGDIIIDKEPWVDSKRINQLVKGGGGVEIT